MTWFKRDKPKIEDQAEDEERKVKTEGIFVKCPECDNSLYKGELQESLQVCTHCEYHFRLTALERLEILFDDGKFERLDEDVTSGDPLEFVDTKPYKDRIEQAVESSGIPEAIITGKGTVNGHLVFAGAMDMSFIGGSMGSAVGEKITRVDRTRARKQGAGDNLRCVRRRTHAGRGALADADGEDLGCAFAAARGTFAFHFDLDGPDNGGVTASFAMLGDVIIAEPRALIGFAGPRVIEQTIRQKLPKGFQRSEFLLEHGMVDMVVDRRESREVIMRLLDFMMNKAAAAA
jgi:acetyl-CoA carboxylase carboxyl transferase subunit beta